MVAALTLAVLLASAPDTVRPSVRVCGFDVSGSMFALWKDARAVCEVELMTAQPGDVVVVRAIGANGYSSGEIVRVKLPPAAPLCSTFDTRCRALSASASAALAQRRRAACTVLRAFVAERAGATDLWGFVQTASDEYASRPGMSRRLVLATDGDWTVQQQVNADLSGTEAFVVLLRTSNSVAGAQKARQRWVDGLARLKAAGVTVRTHAEGPRCS